jgi:hypothetical protein
MPQAFLGPSGPASLRIRRHGCSGIMRQEGEDEERRRFREALSEFEEDGGERAAISHRNEGGGQPYPSVTGQFAVKPVVPIFPVRRGFGLRGVQCSRPRPHMPVLGDYDPVHTSQGPAVLNLNPPEFATGRRSIALSRVRRPGRFTFHSRPGWISSALPRRHHHSRLGQAWEECRLNIAWKSSSPSAEEILLSSDTVIVGARSNNDGLGPM